MIDGEGGEQNTNQRINITEIKEVVKGKIEIEVVIKNKIENKNSDPSPPFLPTSTKVFK